MGLTSFGGPIAHLGYFHEEFVLRRRWLDERAYADLVALCQFLPGPSSSQVGLAIGLSRGGYLGALAAWIGFTLPSAVLMVGFAYGSSFFSSASLAGSRHALKVVAVAIVAQAVWSMALKLTPDRVRRIVASLAALLCLGLPGLRGQLGAIVGGALAGLIFLRETEARGEVHPRTFPRASLFFLTLFLGLLALPSAFATRSAVLFGSFFRAGSLVFGGGHVVLPLLKSEVVDRGWVTLDAFVAGYGFAQAMPGPLFSFTAYLGAMLNEPPNGLAGAALCLGAAFLPSFLLVFGALPLWETVRAIQGARRAVTGINAAVVGVLAAALYQPIWVSAMTSALDVAWAGACLWALSRKWPSWLVVGVSALLGPILYQS